MSKKRTWNKTLTVIIAVSFSAVVLALGVTGGIMLFSPKSDPEYVAHRGYSEYYPDNTAASFTAATQKDFFGIETDVRKTADGVLVCSHDADAIFVDGSKLKVEESTYAELTAKPLKNTKTKDDAYICTFKEYLSICKKGNKVAVVELKDVFTEEMVNQVLAEIDETYDRKKCTVIAFDYDSLYRVRLADPTMELQYLSSEKRDPRFEECLEKGISIDVHYRVLTRTLVKKFHDKGLEVNVWTINDTRRKNRVRRLGVDYVTSNLFYEN